MWAAVPIEIPDFVQQEGTYVLTGTVVDEAGIPVIGANIVEKGTLNGTVTDMDGNFSLRIHSDAVLTVSYIGYTTLEIPTEGKEKLDIQLKEDSQALSEIVVVGYGTQKKVNLTGAVEQVTSEVFDNRSVANATQALQGSIPNLNIQLTDGKPNRTASFNVRGTTSIGQGGNALVLIDGVEGDPSMLNPNENQLTGGMSKYLSHVKRPPNQWRVRRERKRSSRMSFRVKAKRKPLRHKNHKAAAKLSPCDTTVAMAAPAARMCSPPTKRKSSTMLMMQARPTR